MGLLTNGTTLRGPGQLRRSRVKSGYAFDRFALLTIVSRSQVNSLIDKGAVRDALAAFVTQAYNTFAARVGSRAAPRLPHTQTLLLLTATCIAHPPATIALPVGASLGYGHWHEDFGPVLVPSLCPGKGSSDGAV